MLKNVDFSQTINVATRRPAWKTDKGNVSLPRSHCCRSSASAHLRRVSPNRIIYRQSLNIWIGTTRTRKKLSQRHGEVVAPPMHREVKATKTVGLGLRYHRGLGPDVNSRPCVRPVEAPLVHVARVRRKPCGAKRRCGEECLLAESLQAIKRSAAEN